MDHTTNNDLAPCPFCGGAARFEKNNKWRDLIVDHAKDCLMAGDAAEMSYLDGPGIAESMRAKWNRRSAASVQSDQTGGIADDKNFAALLGVWKGLLDYHQDSEAQQVMEAWSKMASYIDSRAALSAVEATKGLDADEMTRLRRLMAALGMDGSMNASDEQVRGLLFTALGQAAGKVERAATHKAGAEPVAVKALEEAAAYCDQHRASTSNYAGVCADVIRNNLIPKYTAPVSAAPTVPLMDAAAKVIRAWRDSPVNRKDDWLRDMMGELVNAHSAALAAPTAAEVPSDPANIVQRIRERVERLRYIDKTSMQMLVEAADTIDRMRGAAPTTPIAQQADRAKAQQDAPTDSERLDALEGMHDVPGKQCSALGYSIVTPSSNGWTVRREFGGLEHPTLREAIDAALSSQKGAQDK